MLKKKLVAAVCSVAMIFSNIAFAAPVVKDEPNEITAGNVELFATTASGTCGDNLTWELTDDGTLTISGTGDMWDWTAQSVVDVPWKQWTSNVKNIIINDGVTGIGDLSFLFSRNLASITIPASLTKIGVGAFSNCTNLSTINVSNSNAHFKTVDGVLYSIDEQELYLYPANKSGLYYDILDSTKTIKDSAFDSCVNLKNISIPSSVVNIEDYAFELCKNLSHVAISSAVTNIGRDIFWHIGTDYTIIDVTLYGEAGSSTETYAQENNISFNAISPVADSEYYLDVSAVKDGEEAVYGTDFVAKIGEVTLDEEQYSDLKQGNLSSASLIDVVYPNNITSIQDVISKLTFNKYSDDVIIKTSIHSKEEKTGAEIVNVSTNVINSEYTTTAVIQCYESNLNSSIIYADYDNYNVLNSLYVKDLTLSEGTSEYNFTSTANIRSIKVMLWDSLIGMTPLSDSSGLSLMSSTSEDDKIEVSYTERDNTGEITVNSNITFDNNTQQTLLAFKGESLNDVTNQNIIAINQTMNINTIPVRKLNSVADEGKYTVLIGGYKNGVFNIYSDSFMIGNSSITPIPTVEPTAEPTATPTVEPTTEPTPIPTYSTLEIIGAVTNGNTITGITVSGETNSPTAIGIVAVYDYQSKLKGISKTVSERVVEAGTYDLSQPIAYDDTDAYKIFVWNGISEIALQPLAEAYVHEPTATPAPTVKPTPTPTATPTSAYPYSITTVGNVSNLQEMTVSNKGDIYYRTDTSKVYKMNAETGVKSEFIDISAMEYQEGYSMWRDYSIDSIAYNNYSDKLFMFGHYTTKDYNSNSYNTSIYEITNGEAQLIHFSSKVTLNNTGAYSAICMLDESNVYLFNSSGIDGDGSTAGRIQLAIYDLDEKDYRKVSIRPTGILFYNNGELYDFATSGGLKKFGASTATSSTAIRVDNQINQLVNSTLYGAHNSKGFTVYNETPYYLGSELGSLYSMSITGVVSREINAADVEQKGDNVINKNYLDYFTMDYNGLPMWYDSNLGAIKRYVRNGAVTPTPTPTLKPTATPTIKPSDPTATPTVEPTNKPTATPTIKPTATPIPTPTPTPYSITTVGKVKDLQEMTVSSKGDIYYRTDTIKVYKMDVETGAKTEFLDTSAMEYQDGYNMWRDYSIDSIAYNNYSDKLYMFGHYTTKDYTKNTSNRAFYEITNGTAEFMHFSSKVTTYSGTPVFNALCMLDANNVYFNCNGGIDGDGTTSGQVRLSIYDLAENDYRNVSIRPTGILFYNNGELYDFATGGGLKKFGASTATSSTAINTSNQINRLTGETLYGGHNSKGFTVYNEIPYYLGAELGSLYSMNMSGAITREIQASDVEQKGDNVINKNYLDFFTMDYEGLPMWYDSNLGAIKRYVRN